MSHRTAFQSIIPVLNPTSPPMTITSILKSSRPMIAP